METTEATSAIGDLVELQRLRGGWVVKVLTENEGGLTRTMRFRCVTGTLAAAFQEVETFLASRKP